MPYDEETLSRTRALGALYDTPTWHRLYEQRRELYADLHRVRRVVECHAIRPECIDQPNTYNEARAAREALERIVAALSEEVGR